MSRGGVQQDLIAAVATPPGQGGIGVVRLSGPGARDVGEGLCGCELTPRRATFAAFRDGEDVLDEGIALYFAQPASFTGEDVVELQCHGSPVVMQQLLDAACARGARLAGPGEFSERAFLNGKLDLAQAEAVADLIAATSVAAARAAVRSLRGEFSEVVHRLAETLAQLRMLVEACIDFPDEDVEFLEEADVGGQISALLRALEDLRGRSQQGQLVNEGIHVALIGPPNAGKSSLLNALAGEEAAIVTDVPGTTRDLLKVDLVLSGMPLRLIDTAGLRDSDDTVERIGIARAREQADVADLVIVVLDAALVDAAAIDAAVNALAPPQGPRRLVVMNKLDLIADPGPTDVAEGVFWISARTGDGVERLKRAIVDAAGLSGAEIGFTARARHLDSLDKAYDALQKADQQLRAGEATEIVAEELRDGHNALGEIVGTETPDDLLGRIFSEFCIGK